MDLSANVPILPQPPGPSGELVIQNGRLQGARRSLAAVLTLLGQSSGCDVRLNEAGVGLFHCAILRDRTGWLLRDLDSPTGTRVNGQPIHTHHLVNGDLIEVGPIQFAVVLDAPTTSEAPSADVVLAEREREALRIQAAAVAAQQASLSEEEARLAQRGTALARQEAQLASHLEDRQRLLDEQQGLFKQEYDAFQAECVAVRETLTQERQALAQERKEVQEQKAAYQHDRNQLRELRRRMWRRYQRMGKDREARLKRQEAELAAGQQRLEHDRQTVRSILERVNTELELGRRQLREERQTLELEQHRWETSLNQEKAEQQRRIAELEKREGAIAAAEQALALRSQRCEEHLLQLTREAEGLETRIRNQRTVLDQLQREKASRQPEAGPVQIIPVVPLSPALTCPAKEHLPASIDGLAGLLRDQRAHLAEQWQRLLEVHQRWQQERTTTLAQMQATAEELAKREQQLAAGEQRLRQAEAQLRQREQELSQTRGWLEGWRTRLAVEEVAWQARRDELLAHIDERERLLEQRRYQLEEIQLQSENRRKEELANLQAARTRCEFARQEYSRLWQDCEQLRQALTEQERALAGKAHALERYWQETTQAAPDSARAERQLDRLSKREISRLDVETREVQCERSKLLAERARLDEDMSRLGQLEQQLIAREQEWSHQVAEWERHRAAVEEEWQKRDQEMLRQRAQHASTERQLRQLREELELLVRVLIEDAETPAAQQAA